MVFSVTSDSKPSKKIVNYCQRVRTFVVFFL